MSTPATILTLKGELVAMASVQEMLCDAISSLKVLEVEYFPGMRLVEPHCLGSSKDGNLLLRAFQTSGASESGEHENWKLFRLDRFQNVKITDARFDGPRPEYKKNDKAMKGGIISQL
jgi:predicted DNA-binding transcriptional regulator YafY